MTRLSFTIAFFIAINSIQPGYSQDYTLKVWPGNIPGSIDNATYIENSEQRDNSNNWITNVSDPAIDVYLATGEEATGVAIVICPGGAYSGLAVGHEGRDVAEWLIEQGITGVVLKYRLPSDEIMEDKSIGPLQDVQEAVRIVRRNAAKWNLDTQRIGVMGFSAGGHLASTASTHFNDMVYDSDEISARPDFSILVYPVILMDDEITHMGSRNNLLGTQPTPEQVVRFSNDTRVGPETPPAFVVHSMDDGAVSPENSIRYVQSLKKYNIPAELHLYEGGGHGYGLGRGSGTETHWPDACINWLKMNEILE
ncbi:alpha/beta hydrolase [Bacteroidota bacterium]